jgi:hypothetical protein
VVGISDAVGDATKHPSWLFHHTLGGCPTDLGWWLVVLLPPVAFYTAARALDPEITTTLWAFTLTATLVAYAVLVAL